MQGLGKSPGSKWRGTCKVEQRAWADGGPQFPGGYWDTRGLSFNIYMGTEELYGDRR